MGPSPLVGVRENISIQAFVLFRTGHRSRHIDRPFVAKYCWLKDWYKPYNYLAKKADLRKVGQNTLNPKNLVGWVRGNSHAI